MFFYLLEGNAVVLEEKEAVVADGSFDLLDKVLDYSWVLRVHQGQVNRLQLRKVMTLFCHWWWNPFWD